MKKHIHFAFLPFCFLVGCQTVPQTENGSNNLSRASLEAYASNYSGKKSLYPDTTTSNKKQTPAVEKSQAVEKLKALGDSHQVPEYLTNRSSVTRITDILTANIHQTTRLKKAAHSATKTQPVFKKIENQYANDAWQQMRQGFSLPDLHDETPLQAHFEKWYGSQKRYFHQISQRGYWYLPHILQEVEKRGLPTEIALLPAIESKYTPDAVSRSKAKGIWQFMAPTARHYGLTQNQWIDARSDLIESTQAALDYLEYLHDYFDGDWILAIAAYNGGEGTISRAMKRNKKLGLPEKYSALKLHRETKEYVNRLLAVRNIVKNPEKFNVELLDIPYKPTLSIVDSGHQIDLEVAASLIPLSYEELKSFNVAYKQGLTPPDGPHHLAIPSRYESQLKQGLEQLPVAKYMRWNRYIVRSGDVLGSIASRHGTTVSFIKQANNLNSNIIRVGQTLKLPRITGSESTAQIAQQQNENNRFYVVKAGDSLWQIARNNGISLSRLVSWNNLATNSTLKLGQKIQIPQ